MKTKTILITLIAILAIAALVFQSCKKEDDKDEKVNKLPTCQMTAPVNNQEIIKGETVIISVEASDSDGTITEVSFFVDGVEKSSSSSAPYNYSWTTTSESIGNHTLKATSTDNSGGNTSDEITIQIIEGGGGNTAPNAEFTVSPSSGTTSTNFAFDATGCADNEDTTSDLQVRWDFDDNGSWDTDWDYNKTVSHQYSNEAIFSAILEVKDTEGLTGLYIKSITVSNGGSTGTFTDLRDGQVYNIVDIGNQTWFSENLNYETTSSWWFDNSNANGDIYGRLYTWDVALTACPTGWHLPTIEEWTVLIDFLGGAVVAGGTMKETGTIHWISPNTDATNSCGFTGLPGGSRAYTGSFISIGASGLWWTSSELSSTNARMVWLSHNNAEARQSYTLKTNGFSIRCIKD